MCFVSWTRREGIRCFSEGGPGTPVRSGGLPEVVSAQRWAWMSLQIHMSKETCPSEVSQNSEKSHTSQWSTFLSFRGDILPSFLSKKCSEAPRARLRALCYLIKRFLMIKRIFCNLNCLFPGLCYSIRWPPALWGVRGTGQGLAGRCVDCYSPVKAPALLGCWEGSFCANWGMA